MSFKKNILIFTIALLLPSYTPANAYDNPADILGDHNKNLPNPSDTSSFDNFNFNLQTPNTLNIEVSGNTKIDFYTYNVGEGYTVNYHFTNPYTVVNKVQQAGPAYMSQIFGSITQSGAQGNVYLFNPNGFIIGPNANINVSNFLISTLNIKDDDVNKIFNNNELIVALDVPNNYSAIVVRNGAEINTTNQLTFVTNVVENRNDFDFSNAQYVTTDGVVFELNNDGSINNTKPYSESNVFNFYANFPSIKGLPFDGHYLTQNIIPPPAPPVTGIQPIDTNANVFQLSKFTTIPVSTPTSLKLGTGSLNIANTNFEVTAPGETQLANEIQYNQLTPIEYGVIAVNRSNEHILPVSNLTPIAAASQVDNTQEELEEGVDLIIPFAIIK